MPIFITMMSEEQYSMLWIRVDESGREICPFEDASFPFGVWEDEYDKMDGNVLPCHWHEAVEFAYVVSGKIEMRIGETAVMLNRGECAFINSNTLHSGKRLESGEETRVFATCFLPDMLAGGVHGTVYNKYLKPVVGKVSGCKISPSVPNGKRIIDLLDRLCNMRNRDHGYELAVLSALSDLWFKTFEYVNAGKNSSDKRNSTFKSKAVKAMILYVQEHYQEKISIDTLAADAHISRSECFRCFKYYTGKTPVDYVNGYRLSAAANLLKGTEETIAEICNICGFSSQSYFGKLFKQLYGISPLMFRNSNGN